MVSEFHNRSWGHFQSFGRSCVRTFLFLSSICDFKLGSKSLGRVVLVVKMSPLSDEHIRVCLRCLAFGVSPALVQLVALVYSCGLVVNNNLDAVEFFCGVRSICAGFTACGFTSFGVDKDFCLSFKKILMQSRLNVVTPLCVLGFVSVSIYENPYQHYFYL